MDKISGGLSQSFGFPLLTAYLFFLSRNSLVLAGAVIFLGSLLNPYIFLLCAVTHGIFLACNIGKIILPWFRRRGLATDHSPASVAADQPVTGNSVGAGFCSSIMRELRASFMRPQTIFASVLLVIAGCSLIVLKYVFYSPPEFGPLVTWGDMVGQIEYTAAGRYEIIPIPPMFYELVRPWIFNLPFTTWGLLPAWILACFGLGSSFFPWLVANGTWIWRRDSGFSGIFLPLPCSCIWQPMCSSSSCSCRAGTSNSRSTFSTAWQ